MPSPRPPLSVRLPLAVAWTADRFSAAIAHAGVQLLLFVLWIGALWVVYRSVVFPVLDRVPIWWLLDGHLGLPGSGPRTPTGPGAPQSQQALAWAVVALCALPKILAFCVAVLIRHRRERVRHQLVSGTLPGDSVAWDEVLQRVIFQWDAESVRAREGLGQTIQYAGFFGFVTSLTLACCALLLAQALDAAAASSQRFVDMLSWPRYAMAVSAATAASVSFALNLGRILVRAARRDASARLFAWAARAQLLVVAATVMLLAFLLQSDDPIVKSPQGFLVVGAAVALFGERSLQALSDRASKVLGLPPMKAQPTADLQLLDGVSEDDVVRLSEEGVDSVHALAFAPTARLYFSTTFSLQRLCDWQDQALLLTYTGAKAQLFREQTLTRGAMAVQRLAEELLRTEAPTPIDEHAPPEAGSGPALGPADLEELSKRLGFASAAQARVALTALSDDEAIRRLRVYARASIQRVYQDPGT